MRFLRKNTAVIVTVGPFYDKTDGVTIETALTITNERITLTADTDDGSAPTNILDNVTGATSATDNDLNYITGNDAGMMQLELSAANVNRLGRMLLSITDAANHVPVFHEFMVVNAALYDAFFATTGGAIPNAAADAAGGLPISDAGGLDLDAQKADVAAILVDTGTTLQGEVDGIQADTEDIQSRLPAALTANGNMKSSLMEILATALTETAGQIAGAFKKFFDKAAPTGTVNSLADAVPGAAGGGFIAGTNAATSIVTGSGPALTLTTGEFDALRITGTSLSGAVALVNGSGPGLKSSITGSITGDLSGTIGSLGAQAKLDVNAEVDTAIADARLDELLAADSDIDGLTPPTVGSVVHEMLSKTAGSFTFDQTTDSLEAVRDKLTDIETDTAAIGAAGAGLTAVPWNAAWDAEVESEATDALNAYDPPTKAEQDTAFTEIKGATWAVTDTLEAIRDKETDIETDTTEIGVAGAGLTNINLPNQTMDIVGNITGNLSGSVGSVTGAVGSVTGAVGSVTGAVGSVTGLTASDVGAIKANTDNLPSAVKKNTARRLHFYMVLASDHVTPATGLTVAATRALDGALLFTAAAGAVTEVASGWYFIDAAAGDLNGDTVAWKMTAATADPCCFSILTEP